MHVGGQGVFSRSIDGLGDLVLRDNDFLSGALPCRVIARRGARLTDGHRAEIDTLLQEHGAVRFEGFGVTDAGAFARAAAVIGGGLSSEAREHPLVNGYSTVYNATPYPSHLPILAHSENSHLPQWPRRIIFGCIKAANRGGETMLADCELALRRAPQPLAEALETCGIEYQRVLGGGLGLDWRAFFGVETRDAAEAACLAQGYDYTWLDAARLRLRWRRPAVAQHVHTGRPVWFNQITHFHPALLPDGMGDLLCEMFREDELPRNCRLGNGEPISAADARSMAHVFECIAFGETWNIDQVLMVDNMRLAHARAPYEGERVMLVAVADVGP